MDVEGTNSEDLPWRFPEDETILPDMEQVWREYLAQDYDDSSEDVTAEEEEVFSRLRQIRHEYGFMVYADVYVLAPVCSACTYMACRRADVPMSLPDVFGATWPRDYATLGISIQEIRATRRGIQEGWQGVRCRTCGEILLLHRDVDFYIEREPLSQYCVISQYEIFQGRRIRKKLKQEVLKVFGYRCTGCHQTVEPDKVTIDHIIPFSHGGSTQLENLQPLCHACNQEKADQPVDIVDINLTFLLLPPPSHH